MHLKITFLGWWIPWMFLTPWGAGEWICACCCCWCCCIPFVNVTFRTGGCFGSGGCWGRWGWPSGWKKPASSPPCWNQQHNSGSVARHCTPLPWAGSCHVQLVQRVSRALPAKANWWLWQARAKAQPGNCPSAWNKSLLAEEQFTLFRLYYNYNGQSRLFMFSLLFPNHSSFQGYMRTMVCVIFLFLFF